MGSLLFSIYWKTQISQFKILLLLKTSELIEVLLYKRNFKNQRLVLKTVLFMKMRLFEEEYFIHKNSP